MTRFCSFAAAGLALAMLAGSSSAMTPGPHPGYLHALTELRDARWMIEHRGGNERLLALESGAVCIEEPAQTPYGDRRAMIVDPFGNEWQIATYSP